MAQPTREQETEALAREIAQELAVALPVARVAARKALARLAAYGERWDAGVLEAVAEQWDEHAEAARRHAGGAS